MSRNNERRQCAYCGRERLVTRDHVIPKCVFGQKKPTNPAIAPACHLEKSKDDDYLRDLMVLDIKSHGHPVAQEIIDGPLLRSARHNHSRLARAVQLSSRMEPMVTPAGLYVGTFPVVPLEEDRVQKIFGYLVRGLYHHVQGGRLPTDCEIRTWVIYEQTKLDLIASMNQHTILIPFTLRDVFTCWYLVDPADLKTSVWITEFYGAVCHAAVTTRQATP